ncbi:hypothetical protein BCON_0007g00890 [Botryotinia convoluta]|uniref:Zn(2)-C6 fungal-type domain-containing protein n=1 Tax=Botryotinia convoluta TaxID=54673 RepID=A0A4Z1ISG8_9HELO|nr:hypothetical protein BCON_0007g00890 [Botryotinia convoluta]
MPRGTNKSSGMATVPLKRKDKRTRAYFPKTRTGCWTCRKRRVKCDEEKPHCARCEASGFKCDGYSVDAFSQARKRASVVQKSQPKRKSSVTHRAILPSKAPKTARINIRVLRPRSPIVETEQEYRYFCFFTENTTRRLCGFFESKLWSHLMLQAGEQERPIRHAMSAIGALDLILHTKEQKSHSPVARSTIEDHHIFAIKQYDKAVKLMKADIAERGHSLRTALLFCLLIVCFENLYGTQQSATVHIIAGIRLIETYHHEHTSRSDKSPLKKAEKSDASTDSITFGISSPVPSDVEDEIYQAFGLLEIASLSFNVDGRGMAYHMLAKDSGSSCVKNMPSRFVSLPEAKAYWDLIMRRLLHLLPTLNTAQATMRGYEDDNETAIITKSSSAVIEEQERYLAELISWHEAFTPVLQKCRLFPSSKDFAGATILKLRWILCRIAINSALIPSQVALDQYLEDFREVLNSAKSLMSHPAWTGKFTFDSGIISQIYFVALKCRNFPIRSEAISLLLSKSWREGVWDSAVAGNIAKAVVGLEEEGREAGFIPESKRVYQTSMRFDLQKRTGTVKCFRNIGNPSEREHPITKSIKW